MKSKKLTTENYTSDMETRADVVPVFGKHFNNLKDDWDAHLPSDGTGKFNTINEYTSGSGVTIDGVKLQDNKAYLDTDIVAAAGTAQSDAAALTGQINIVTGADGTTGVILPAVEENKVLEIFSIATNATPGNVALSIYPASGEKINGGTADAAITLTPAANEQCSVKAVKKADGDWYVVENKGTIS